MASPEDPPFQPRNVRTPDTGAGGGLLSEIEPKIPEQSVEHNTPNLGWTCPSAVDAQYRIDNALSASSSEIADVVDPSPQDAQTTLRQARRQLWEETGYAPPIAGGAPDQSAKQEPDRPSNQHNQAADPAPSSGWLVVGRGDFVWTRDLSPNGQMLYRWLLYDMGDREDLPQQAVEEGWDLDAALKELQAWAVLDESDPARYKLR